MKKKIIITIFLTLIAICMFTCQCQAVDLDEIINYTTTISPRNDGTLDIKYNIQWKVLNSTLEGPLEWVKIGIPNKHVDEIKKISNNIKKIKYTSSGGSYVRIDFKDKYEAGEIVTFEFSIHQSYMYNINDTTGKVTYTFTPGWFEDIEVKQATIKWEARDVTRSSGNKSGEYIVWSRALGKNQKITAKVEYPIEKFNLNYRKQADKVTMNDNNGNKYTDPNTAILLISIIFVGVYIISLIFTILSPSYYRHGGYGYHSRYYPRGYYHHYHHRSHWRRRIRWWWIWRPEAEALHVHVRVHVQEEAELDVLKKTFMEQI